MANLDNLRSHGWHITEEGLNNLLQNGADVRNITRRALDVDIRDFGAPIIATELNKATFGPGIVQIVKIKNISAPKSKQNSQGAPRMLKLILTDGHTNCQGVEISHIPGLSLEKTVPGTKLFISGAPVLSGSVLLTPDSCKVLGGSVSALVEKWEVSKLMPSHIRHNEDGPPAWVNFGKKIVNTLDSRGFKSLENKNKDASKENAEFQNLRQDAILEATQGAVKKVFGGGVKPAQTFNDTSYQNRENFPQRAPRQPKGKKNEPEKMEKPSQRVSLFDFLEDKLSLSEPQPQAKSQTITKVFNEVPFTSKPKPDYEKNYNNYKPTSNYSTSTNNSTSASNTNKFKPSSYSDRFQTDKPPRFQRQRQFGGPGGPEARPERPERPKPNTNIFVDKLANEINNISLYNNKYETEKLKTNRAPENFNANKNWRWKIGDRCMAKYWEDDKFYNAVVTGITTKTIMVEFVEYGNFEEVLHCDCIPITTEKEDRKHTNTNRYNNDNQDFSGSIEFRRGKTRPFVKNSKPGQNKNYES